MKAKKRSRLWRSLVFLTLLCSLILALPARAEENETVRVGLFVNEGYHTVDKAGGHSGYDYEYLAEIAKYTGWNYEFVEGTWQECITRLEAGQIDLLGGVRMEKSGGGDLCFPSMPSLYSVNCLLIEKDSDDYAYEDFEAFDGMRIGCLAATPFEEMLAEYSREHGFTYTLLHYGNEASLEAALETGRVDCIYLSDSRFLGDYEVIACFGYTPRYYAVTPARPDLVEPLSDALSRIHAKNHYYESDLDDKYLNSGMNVAQTQAEQRYVAEHNVVQVALIPEFPIFCDYDPETGSYTGIIIDVLDRLSAHTGLQFEYTTIPGGVPTWEYMKQNPNVLIAPFFNNELISYGDKVQMLDPVVRAHMIAVSRSGENLALDGVFRLAVPVNMYSAEAQLRVLYPQAELVSCSSHRDGINMVARGEADLALVNEVSGAYMIQSPFYEKLRFVNTTSIAEDLTIGTSSASDKLLLSVLNKGIAALAEHDARQILVDNTVERAYTFTPIEWVYKYRVALLALLAALVTLTFASWLARLHRRSVKEEAERRRLEEVRRKADLEYQNKMYHQANFDALTGIYNHDCFIEKANELLRKHPDVTYTFFRIDIDQFKVINEFYSTARGDWVLCQIADKLRSEVGDRGIYCRLYADQFGICYPADEMMVRSLNNDNLLLLDCGGQIIRVQLNVGVYVNTEHYQDAQLLIGYALVALQNADKVSGDHFYFYKDEYLEKLLRNQRITNEMEQALREGQFQVYLQPQYEIDEEKLVGAEALVRWIHPERGIVPPGVFIPVFERNGFIYRLDSYVCNEVCRLLAGWKEQDKLVPVSINLSRIDLQNPELLQMLKETLARWDVPIQALHLEITESAYVDNKNVLDDTVAALKEAGFLIEMDDFGSGYSSLNMLKDVPVDILKLDMRFFDGETHMDKGGNIIDSVVSLAHDLGIMVIAEGVETEREVNFLKSIRCRVVQGYLYGRPMPAGDFSALLARSEVGEKSLGAERYHGTQNLYWDLEKYTILLQDDDAILFDYDPSCDYAMFTYIGASGLLEEHPVEYYAEHLPENAMVHPEDRAKLAEMLRGMKEPVAELEFRGDYWESGKYKCYHAMAYGCFRDGKLSRVIAVLRRTGEEL